jgi:hypothetical protein
MQVFLVLADGMHSATPGPSLAGTIFGLSATVLGLVAVEIDPALEAECRVADQLHAVVQRVELGEHLRPVGEVVHTGGRPLCPERTNALAWNHGSGARVFHNGVRPRCLKETRI